MAGVSNPYLSQIERGLRKPSAEILQQIARALEISAETLYVQVGILEPRDGEVDVIGEIRRDPALTDDQRKTLVHIYETFRSETAVDAASTPTNGRRPVTDTAESTAGSSRQESTTDVAG
jgi:transcriptional regulator with XRE-family HTH domain